VPGEDATCPRIGETPRFTRALTQLLLRNCDGYNFAASRGLAVAVCHSTSSGDSTVEVGPVDDMLAPAAGMPVPNGFLISASISQDEQRIYVAYLDGESEAPFVIDTYRRQEDGWVLADTPQLRSDPGARLGSVAAVGGRDRVVLSNIGITEYVIDGGWNVVRTTTAAELGVELVTSFSMTPDGLRATFMGGVQIHSAQFYTDRPSVDDAFRPGVPLDVSYYPGAFMTADCGRIYESGIGSVFYARQAR
jgi:hypothetical protein